MPYEPLHHKYRPQTFSDLVGQETIALTLTNALKQEKIAPAYMFTGPRGTGKTSSARILAKSLNCLASDRPTPHPCGKCEACLAIAKGSALDVMEIDAASNTGVDNIREIIERSRFAPVQCRYKIYAIDECLAGDSLIQTDEGLTRIDNPNLKGEKVLSYNENRQTWEYKKVLRWLKRGTKKTLIIKTSDRQIRCTENHLIRTEIGWVEARQIEEGMKILSPVNVDVEIPSTNTVQMAGYADLHRDISLEEINTAASPIILAKFLSRQKQYNPCVNVDVEKSLMFPNFSKKVESVSLAGYEPVYDLEVEDNHNFVANGLLVHNCHMLSTAAFNALLKTLEEPPPQVVFVLATTDPQRVLSTIISRCQRFDYRRIPLEPMTAHLKYIAEREQIAIADDALTLIAQIANGGLRDAESLLDQLSLLPETITVAKVWDLVGAVPEQDLIELLRAINRNDPLAVLQQCRSLLDRGREPLVVLQNLAGFYLNLLIAKTAPQRSELTAVTETCWQQLCIEASNWDAGTILRGQQQLKEAETQLKQTTQPRLWLEVALLELLPQVNTAIARPETVTPQAISHNLESSGKNSATTAPNSSPAITSPVAVSPAPEKVAVPASTQKQTERKTPAIADATPVSPLEVVNEPVQPPQQDTANNREIWSKVVSCLQPPTTQALLKQQCHLVSFDGSSAIVGISSAKLQKLHQGKVPNIEAAFARVCQHKVKVQLEAADAAGTTPQTASIPEATPVTNINRIQPPPSQDPAPPPNRQSPIATPSTNSKRSPVPTHQEATPSKPKNTESLQQDRKAIAPNTNSSFPSTSPSLTVSEEKVNPELVSTTIEPNSVSDPDSLQQAIDNLTLSFEGELVQLDNPLEEFSSPQIEQPESIALERPDVEDYDDEW